MAIFLYFFTIALNLVLGVRYGTNRNKKINSFFFFLSFISIYLLMSGYRNSSGLSNDLSYNQIDYNKIVNGIESSYEIGFYFIMKLGSFFTDDFYLFRSYSLGFFLILLFYAIKKWASSPHYVISLFCSYLIILSSEQLRYFFAFVIFCISISILVYSNNPRKRLYFNILLILASLIHFSFIVYIIFNIEKLSFSKKREKRIAITVILFCIIIFLNNNKIPGLTYLLKYNNNYKISIYMGQKTNLGFLLPFILQATSIVLTLWAYKLSSKSNQLRTIIYPLHIYKLNLLAIVFFPLFMLQLTFYRLIRNLLILNYFLYSDIIISKAVNFKNRLLFSSGVFMSIIIWFIVDLFITSPAKSLLIPFFTENIYFY